MNQIETNNTSKVYTKMWRLFQHGYWDSRLQLTVHSILLKLHF